MILYGHWWTCQEKLEEIGDAVRQGREALDQKLKLGEIDADTYAQSLQGLILKSRDDTIAWAETWSGSSNAPRQQRVQSAQPSSPQRKTSTSGKRARNQSFNNPQGGNMRRIGESDPGIRQIGQ